VVGVDEMVAADAAGAAAVAVAAAVHVTFAVVVHSIRLMEVVLNLFVRNGEHMPAHAQQLCCTLLW
jgi:hypothetical protein